MLNKYLITDKVCDCGNRIYKRKGRELYFCRNCNLYFKEFNKLRDYIRPIINSKIKEEKRRKTRDIDMEFLRGIINAEN